MPFKGDPISSSTANRCCQIETGESSVGTEALELVSLPALERPSPVSTQSGKQHHPDRVPYHIRLHFYAVIPAVRNGILGALATLDSDLRVYQTIRLTN
jgi:hypothetical protein